MSSGGQIRAVRPADGVGLQTPQAKLPAVADRTGDFQRLCRRACAGAMISYVEIDQKIDGAAGGRVPFDLSNVIDNGHRAGLGDAGDFRGVGEWRSQQDAGNRIVRHQLCFGHCGDGDSARAVLHLAPGDLDAFVRLRVRAQLLAGLIRRLRHASEVGFEKAGVEEQSGCGNLGLFEQRPLYEL